jgi:hypothetical protein
MYGLDVPGFDSVTLHFFLFLPEFINPAFSTFLCDIDQCVPPASLHSKQIFEVNGLIFATKEDFPPVIASPAPSGEDLCASGSRSSSDRSVSSESTDFWVRVHDLSLGAVCAAARVASGACLSATLNAGKEPSHLWVACFSDESAAAASGGEAGAGVRIQASSSLRRGVISSWSRQVRIGGGEGSKSCCWFVL